MRYILGIDIGSTSIKAALVGEDGKIYCDQSREYPLTTLPTGEVEAELQLYIDAFKGAVTGVLKKSAISPDKIAAIGFSSTAETCVFLDEDNRPLCPVIAWMDTRATAEAEFLSSCFPKEEIIKRVGFDGIYAIHPVSKILAVKNRNPEIFEKTRMFAQIKDYFIFYLCGEYDTDHSTASDHGFFDISERKYWKEMLELTGIREEYLPKLLPPGSQIGKIRKEAALELGLSGETLINVGAFDQGCGAIGAGNIKPGIASECTGSALVTVSTVERLNPNASGEVPTLCSGVPGKYIYQPYCSGSIIMKWYRDVFCEAEKQMEKEGGPNAYTLMDEMAMKTPAGADGLIMLPYFQGSGIPEANEKAQGVYYGIHAGHTRGHFIRAIMEGLAIALKRMLECEKKQGAEVTEIRSLGGGSKSKVWCQIKADILQIPVKVIENSQSTACMGCVILAGTACKIWPSIEEAAQRFVSVQEVYKPNPANAEIYEKLYQKYVEVSTALNVTF